MTAKKNRAAATLGRLGGKTRSAAQAAARRANGAKGGRPVVRGTFCACEHLGGCHPQLTHRLDYFIGRTRQRVGRWAYYCAWHAPLAAHLPLEPLRTLLDRQPRPQPPAAPR